VNLNYTRPSFLKTFTALSKKSLLSGEFISSIFKIDELSRGIKEKVLKKSVVKLFLKFILKKGKSEPFLPSQMSECFVLITFFAILLLFYHF
jgi:hypothetical protein